MLRLLLNGFAILILTSCTTLPIEMKSLISIVGFDMVGDKVEITALLKNPNVLGKTQNSSKQNEKPSSLLKMEGHSIDFATHQASRFIPRHIDWNHLHMVIISEDLAKKNLQHILDFLAREPEASTSPYVFISKENSVRTLLEDASKFSYPPFFMLHEIIEPAKEHAFVQPVRLKEILNKVDSNLTDIIIPGIQINEEKYKTAGGHPSFEIKDAGVIHHGKMIGWLGSSGIEGVLWANGNMWDHSFEIKLPETKLYVNFDVSKHQGKKKALFSNGKLKGLDIQISVSGRITEISREFSVDKLQDKEVEENLTKDIKTKVEEAVQFSQKYGTDIFGFGYKIRKKNQAYWLQHGEKWSEEKFPEIPVNIRVKTTVKDWGELRKKALMN